MRFSFLSQTLGLVFIDEKTVPIVPVFMIPSQPMQEIEKQIREIFDRYAALIRSVIQTHLHTGDALDPQDIEQGIRIKLWKSIRKGKTIDKLPSYLKKMAYTATVDELRRLRKQAPYRDTYNWGRMLLLLEGGAPESEVVSHEENYDQREDAQILDSIMEKLSPDRKRVLRLYACGFSVDDICEFFGWDRTRVRHLLYRGIDDLRQLAGKPVEGGRTVKYSEKKCIKDARQRERI